MRLLLDTHTWIFSLCAPERLSPVAVRALSDAGNELFLSPISAWEAVLLGERGRIELRPSPLEWTRQALLAVAATMSPITHEIALKSRDLEGFANPDPADRFLVATALIEELTLVTRDEDIRGYSPVASLW